MRRAFSSLALPFIGAFVESPTPSTVKNVANPTV
jgi:hypothetical protein